MITALLIPQQRKIVISYPNFTKIKPVEITVRSSAEAHTIIRIRTIKFITNEIRNFISMRCYAYTAGNRFTAERQKALCKLRHIIDTYSESRLEILASQLANARVSFAELMPIKPSPAKTHFDNHIVPILSFCTAIHENNLKN
ncbi:hypothetical protein [Sphingobacterium lactis]|uniref:Uncharacterized protein n=1 Tax=Sphingobacterium lactis TaxID=797291 RepID=A0A1H6BQ15_9SPHI|nr:hypothetical protein [Sphingobacterium lactis]SEG62507.1 hypothetical protein SAMN05421877_11137 [Sphingobacterium lactis]